MWGVNMPKQRITKEMIVETAFTLVREEGEDGLQVKRIAHRLGCSVQPIYSYCESMDGLRQALVAYTGKYISKYIGARVDPNDYFKSVGIGHLRFAKEESNLFKLYFLRKRSDLHSVQDIYNLECSPKVAEHLSTTLCIPMERAKALHLHMTLYSVGLSAILATSQSDIPIEELTAQLEAAYRVFEAQAIKEK